MGATGTTNDENGNDDEVALGEGLAWLRSDCHEFYRNELRATTTKNSIVAPLPVVRVKDRVGLLRLGITKAMHVKKRFPNAQFLEFGVHQGKDLLRMATFLRSIEDQPQQKQHNCDQKQLAYTTFHGFDSFEGLPEDWNNGRFDADDKPFHKKGAFDMCGRLPDLDNLVHHQRLQLGHHGNNNRTNRDIHLDNIQCHKGWFHESLPLFLEQQRSENGHAPFVAFVHADADLYSSTFTVLKLLCDKRLFCKGSIVVFDEFWNYPNWQHGGEYKAWMDIVHAFGLDSKYEYFGYHAPHPNAKQYKAYGYQSVGVVFTSDMD